MTDASTNPVTKVDPSHTTIFTEPGVGWTYLAIFFGSFVFFWGVLYAWKAFFEYYKRNDENYMKFPENFKWNYVQNFAGNVHHIMIFVYCMVQITSIQCSKGHLVDALKGDNVCLMTI